MKYAFSLFIQTLFSAKKQFHAEGNGIFRSKLFVLFTGAFIVAILFAGCGNRGTANTQILSFNYAIVTTPLVATLVQDIETGRRTFTSALGSSPCVYTANFSSSTRPTPPPRIMVHSTPGQTGFTVIISDPPQNIITTNPANCATLTSFEIGIGSNAEALPLHTETSNTIGLIHLPGGREFSRSEFFRARVNSFDTSTHRVTGDFRFINSLSTDSNTVIIVEGSFAVMP